MDASPVGELEGVVPEALGALHVVLVGVGPVELHVLALVGHAVGPLLVAAEGHEVAFAVVATEEVVEVGEDVLELTFPEEVVEEAADLLAPLVQDAVDAEVEVGPVDLEELVEETAQLLTVRRLAHAIGG